MTKDELLDRLRKLAKRLGRKTIKQEDIKSDGLEYWVRKYYRYQADAIKDAGLKTTSLAEKMSIPEEALLKYLFDLGKELNRTPTVADIQRDGRYSSKIFKKIGGHRRAYEIARNRFSSKTPSQRQELPKFDNKGQFWGRAAEFLVCAELLYRGYNANAHGVDLGMDITAVKDNKTFFIQVKNTPYHGNHAEADITESSFLKNQSGNVYYIFVLQDREERNFLILPFYKIRELIDREIITLKSEEEGKRKKFKVHISKADSISIDSNDSRVSENVAVFRNNWGLIS